MNRFLKILLGLSLAAVILPLVYLVCLFSGLFGRMETKEDLLSFRNATATVVLSSDNEPIGRFFIQNRINITPDQVPLYLQNALIATEDARFFEHKGIDTRSLFRVLLKTVILNNRQSGGGSTISQQLAKNMYGRKEYWPVTMLVNKSKEAVLAYRLENAFTKEEILILYLNTVPFGENIYGIEAAAGRYFNKKTFQLTIEESAVLVGMLKANTYYNPRINPDNAISRRNVVLRQMARYGYISPHEADSLCNRPLMSDTAGTLSGGPADYFLVAVRDETQKILDKIYASGGRKWDPDRDGLTITTTLSLPLQKMALDSFREHLQAMQQRLEEQYNTQAGRAEIDKIIAAELKRLNLEHRAGEINRQQLFSWKGTVTDSVTVADSLRKSLLLLHAGLLALDPGTGAVRAWVGGIDFTTQPYDQIYARRQMGSVFKPVLYAAALEEGYKPCQYLDNDSIMLSEYEDWSPENYDHSFGGRYSFAGALIHSMNIPSVSLYLSLGFPATDSLWTKMGFSFPITDNPSLALGTAEASIREVALAFSVFANGGQSITPQLIESIKGPAGKIIYQNDFAGEGERIITERSAQLMNAILQRAASEGTGATMSSIYGVTLPLAAKTGTSQSYADAWFACYNPGITIVCRVGASSQAVRFNSGSNGSGATLALPLVALTLQKAQRDTMLTMRLFMPFPALPNDLSGALDCPDFKEKKLFDTFLDFFRKNDTAREKSDTLSGRKPFLRRIFRK